MLQSIPSAANWLPVHLCVSFSPTHSQIAPATRASCEGPDSANPRSHQQKPSLKTACSSGPFSTSLSCHRAVCKECKLKRLLRYNERPLKWGAQSPKNIRSRRRNPYRRAIIQQYLRSWKRQDINDNWTSFSHQHESYTFPFFPPFLRNLRFSSFLWNREMKGDTCHQTTHQHFKHTYPLQKEPNEGHRWMRSLNRTKQ